MALAYFPKASIAQARQTGGGGGGGESGGARPEGNLPLNLHGVATTFMDLAPPCPALLLLSLTV